MNRSNRNSNSSSAQSNESPINRQSYILMFLRDVLSREESKEENTGRDLLNIMINRTGRSQRASTEENKANNEEALIRRIRRRRYHYFDDQAESADELINPLPDEEYIDFRTYPLSIDWKEVENDESAAYEVFDKFGYFGVSCFTTLSKNNQIKFNEKILKNILDYYVKNFELNTAESIRKIENLINNLPSLDNIKQILILRLVSNKELVPVKLVLDLYEHYYKNFEAPLYNIFINEYIPVALMFYTTLSDEDLNFTYEKIIEEKEIYEILSNLSLNLENNLKFHLSKKRKSYIKYFNKLNNDLMKLVSGINLSHLII